VITRVCVRHVWRRVDKRVVPAVDVGVDRTDR